MGVEPMEYAPENEPTEQVRIHNPVLENSLAPAEAKIEVVGDAPDQITKQSSATQQESLSGQRRRRKQRSENANWVSCSTDVCY